ncbi:predicted protein [Listeria monocytogenes FSL J1-194]|nr:predicted protein [Listeria monocytogenes FSL J1-194]
MLNYRRVTCFIFNEKSLFSNRLLICHRNGKYSLLLSDYSEINIKSKQLKTFYVR